MLITPEATSPPSPSEWTNAPGTTRATAAPEVTSEAETAPPSPPAQSERLPAIDIARGFALIGVALVNAGTFSMGWDAFFALNTANTWYDKAAEWIVGLVFTHKCYPVMAFLFGYGIGLQTSACEFGARADQHTARMWALLIIAVPFGIVLWPGDVLLSYAVMGLLLSRFRRRETHKMMRPIVILATFIYVVLAGVLAYNIAELYNPGTGRRATSPTELTSFQMPIANATFWRARVWEWASYAVTPLILASTWLAVILGVRASRDGALSAFLNSPLGTNFHWLRATAVFLSLLIVLLALGLLGGWDITYNSKWSAFVPTLDMAISLVAIPVFLGIAGAWSRSTVAPWFRHQCMIAGRAPLTQFVGQGLAFALIFSHLFIGLAGRLGRFWTSLVALAVWFMLNALIERVVGQGYAYAPVDAVWRGIVNRLSK